MTNENSKFFSLKPRNDKDEVKNYFSYKKALDYCIKKENNINNIGIIGNYDTGKSTIISAFVNDLEKSKYDIINISLLTLENKDNSNTEILKNIIKQIVHTPHESHEYSILKFQVMKVNWKKVFSFLGVAFVFLFIYFSNTNLLSHIPVLKLIFNLNLPVEFFRICKSFLLIAIIVLVGSFIYPELLAGIRIRKFNVAKTFDAEIKRTTEDIVNEELDYLEYLIYLLRRKEKNLLLVIEDLDRFENLRIFQQLREVNNILNETKNANSYKFIYAIGNSLFTDRQNDDATISITDIYHSSFKEKATKFFDFIINITPIMDNQNSYEFIKSNFSQLISESKFDDEDLFMLSQYINTPRVLIDVVNDFQMMRDMRLKDKGYSDVKLLYYSILKSRFYNFHDIIHEIFDDLELIVKYYSNEEYYVDVETKRKEEFYKLCTLYALDNNNANLNKNVLSSIWEKIKNEEDLSVVNTKHGSTAVYAKSSYTNDKVLLSWILKYATQKQMEFIFSVDQYRHKIGANFNYKTLDFTKILALYYEKNNDIITEIIRHVEIERYNNSNKINFPIKEFLDIDYIQLGIQENLLDINDYNLYVSLNYLDVKDANFIRQFNLSEKDDALFISPIKDADAVLSKMKLEKIKDQNGLNIYIIAHLQVANYIGVKAEQLNINAINHSRFISILLDYPMDEIEATFSKESFLSECANQIYRPESIKVILNWIDLEFQANNVTEEMIDDFSKKLNKSFEFDISDSTYQEITYKCLLESTNVIKDETLLVSILDKIRGGYTKLANIVFEAYFPIEYEDEGTECYVCIDEFEKSEWLTHFNNNIAMFSSLLYQDNILLMKDIYEDVGNIKVKLLQELCDNKDFLLFVYEKNLYEYSVDNVKTLFDQFINGNIPDYSSFVGYSFKQWNLLKTYRAKNEILSLEMKHPWILALIIEVIRGMHQDDLTEQLQFFTDENPIIIEELSELCLDYDQHMILFGFVNLYAHTYKNLTYIYDTLMSKGVAQLEFLDTIFINENFDYETLYEDVLLFDENAELKAFIYKGLYSNNSVSIEVFKKYMHKCKTKLSDGSQLSSQDKIQVLFEMDLIEFNIDNLRLCKSKTLLYILDKKHDILNRTFSKMGYDDILSILEIFEEKDNKITCLINLYKSGYVNVEFAMGLTVLYLRNYRADDRPAVYEGFVKMLLTPFRNEDQDVEKMVSLLEKGKGQRTISANHIEIAKLLSKKNIITCYEQSGAKWLLKYN